MCVYSIIVDESIRMQSSDETDDGKTKTHTPTQKHTRFRPSLSLYLSLCSTFKESLWAIETLSKSSHTHKKRTTATALQQ